MTDDEKIEAVRLCRETEGIEAAQRLWVRLGLSTVPEMFREMGRRRRARQNET